MQLKINKYLAFLFLSLSLFSCKRSPDDCNNGPQLKEDYTTLKSVDLSKELIKLSTQEQALAFIKREPFVSNYFFNVTRQISDTAMAELMIDIFNHPAYSDTLYKEVLSTFPKLTDITDQFSVAFANYQFYYPEIKTPAIKYALSGLQSDLFVSDSLISIALDYYLGPKARFVPLGLPKYMLKRYQKEYIVPMIMLLTSQEKNQTDPSNMTLLADMVYYGKSYYLAKQILPCTTDSLFIGYSAKEMIDIQQNEHIIWANFLENDLLYESSHFIKNKFIGERPNTFEISNNCPGRIGVWVGWQIVNSYMANNPEISVQNLMSTTDVNEIFSKSKYKPKP
jgi:hypothetical protein